MECLAARVKLEVKGFLLYDSAYTLATGVTLAGMAGTVMSLRVALVFVLVLLLATIALGVVRLGLARAATVLALLDGATLGVDVVQFALIVVTTAHSMALDAGRASPLFAIDYRHSVTVTAECGRRSWLATATRELLRKATG